MKTSQRYAMAFDRVLDWCVLARFHGYDPYDGSNTDFRILRAFGGVRLVLTYLNKFSPLNLRPMLGIRPGLSVYALGLINSAILKATSRTDRLAVAAENLRLILGRSLFDKQGYHCWNGNGFPIQRRSGYTTADVPGIVGTEACASSILQFAQRFPSADKELSGVLASVRDFCLDVLLVDTPDRTFFRYTPDTPQHSCVYNASMKAASFVASVNRFLGDDVGTDVVQRAYGFLLDAQKPDGSWFYSVDLRTGKERRQIDFHQGFMLDGLATYIECYGPDEAVVRAYRRGLEFFRSEQFTREGQGLYRHPRKWPANIHNQAQGIVTFSRADTHGLGYGDFARTIADWTLARMYTPETATFHYLRYPFFSNRVPYLRWSQAWMLYALSHLLEGTGSNRLAAEGTAPGARQVTV